MSDHDITLRVASRYAVDMSIPEGAVRVDEGRFILWFAKSNLKLAPQIKAGLQKIEALYASAGIPLRGKVECIVRGAGGGKSYYLSNVIQLNPKSLGFKHEHGHLTHEIAHWQHDRHISGGFGNGEIRAKYKEAMAAPVSQGERDVVDVKKQLAALQAERKRLTDDFLRPLAQKGDLFDAPREFGKGVGTANYKVLKVKPKSVEALVLNPGPFDKAPFTAEIDGSAVNRALAKTDPSIRADIERKAEVLEEKRKEEEKLRSDVFKNVSKTWDQYDTVKSDWMPTTYARENHKEWFAEIVTTMVLNPSLLKDEVKDWVKRVW